MLSGVWFALLRKPFLLTVGIAIPKAGKACVQSTSVLAFHFFIYFFFLFQIGNSSWCCHRSFLCILPSPFSVLLTFNTSLHPFLPFFSSSYNCCSHHCSALLPFSPWHVSLDHLFAAQKATCCSECARTASRPSLALNTEHMLSQLSRAQQ